VALRRGGPPGSAAARGSPRFFRTLVVSHSHVRRGARANHVNVVESSPSTLTTSASRHAPAKRRAEFRSRVVPEGIMPLA